MNFVAHLLLFSPRLPPSFDSEIGDVKITSGMTFTANSAGASPRFTLTCISTGGPATTVAWTRDSVPLNPRQHNMTRVLLDPRTARYSHTLTVAGLEGVYTCAVANDKPSRVSAELAVKGEAGFYLGGGGGGGPGYVSPSRRPVAPSQNNMSK